MNTTRPLADFSESIRLDARSAISHQARGSTYLVKKDYERALADYNEANKLGQKDSYTLADRGQAYVGKQDFEHAREDFLAAKQLSPDSARVNTKLAWFLATCPKDAIRDGNLAVECGMKACEMSYWSDGHALAALAAARAERGQFDDAISLQTRAIAIPLYVQELGSKAQQLLKSFQDHKPWRE